MTIKALIVLAALLPSAVVCSSWAVGADTTQPVDDTRPAADITTGRLGEKIKAVFSATAEPIGDVIHRIEGDHNLKFNVQWEALAKAAVTEKTPMTFKVNVGQSTQTLLKIVLISLNESIQDPDLKLQKDILNNGEIIISTRIDLFKNFVSTQKYLIPRVGDGQLMSSGEIIKMLKNTLPVGSFAEKPDGVGGSATVDHGYLVVTQTEENHRLVAAAMVPLYGR